jgi:DNA-binding NtrC family response regulator
MYRTIIADSDKETLVFFKDLMNGEGSYLAGVSSSRELFDLVATSGAPDILVTEAHLPDVSVDGLMKGLELKCSGSLIVVVTSDASKETSARVRMQGTPIFYFGLKPLSRDEMRHVVQDAVSVINKAS